VRAHDGSPAISRRPFPAFSVKAGRSLHAHSAEAEAAVEIAREQVRRSERTREWQTPADRGARVGMSGPRLGARLSVNLTRT
jgi:hypothetical protein